MPTGTVLLVTTIASGAEVRRDAIDDGPEGGQVGGAVVALRRADGEVDDLGRRDRGGQVGREREPLGGLVVADHFLEAGLVDRDLAALEPVDLGAVDVDASDVVAAVGEAGAGDQSDVAGANNCDFHKKKRGVKSR